MYNQLGETAGVYRVREKKITGLSFGSKCLGKFPIIAKLWSW